MTEVGAVELAVTDQMLREQEFDVRIHTRRLIALAAVLTLAVAACGGGDAQDDEVVDPTTTVAEVENHDDSATTTTTHEDEADHEADHEDEGEVDHEDEGSHEDEGEAAHEVTEADRVIEVEMTEFAFSPASVELTAGETVVFVLTNSGLVDHEFRLSNDHRIEEHIASGHEDHDDEGGHHDEGGDLYIQLTPGATGELMFTVPHDMTLYTDIGCLIPGHHEAGMAGEIVYTDA